MPTRILCSDTGHVVYLEDGRIRVEDRVAYGYGAFSRSDEFHELCDGLATPNGWSREALMAFVARRLTSWDGAKMKDVRDRLPVALRRRQRPDEGGPRLEGLVTLVHAPLDDRRLPESLVVHVSLDPRYPHAAQRAAISRHKDDIERFVVDVMNDVPEPDNEAVDILLAYRVVAFDVPLPNHCVLHYKPRTTRKE